MQIFTRPHLLISIVSEYNNNVIVCAGTGAGKTMSVIEPRLLETYNSSLVVTLSKRRLVKKYTPLLRSRDYGIFDLNLAAPESASVFFDKDECSAR